jgi:hypothetical protein
MAKHRKPIDLVPGPHPDYGALLSGIPALFGPIRLWRAGYRPTDKSGDPTIFPLALGLGLMHGASPALAGCVGQLVAEAGMTQQRALARLRQDYGVAWGGGKLRQLTAAVSAAVAEQRQEAKKQLMALAPFGNQGGRYAVQVALPGSSADCKEPTMLSVFCPPSRYTQGKNANASLGREMLGLGLRGPVLVVAGRSASRLLSSTWQATFGEAGIEHAVHPFGGERSPTEIDRVKSAARRHKAWSSGPAAARFWTRPDRRRPTSTCRW